MWIVFGRVEGRMGRSKIRRYVDGWFVDTEDRVLFGSRDAGDGKEKKIRPRRWRQGQGRN